MQFEMLLLLILPAYLVTLVISVLKFKSDLVEELKFFGWYFAVGVLAALWSHEVAFNAVYKVEPAGPCDDCNINLFGMLRTMWNNVVRPFMFAFVVLSAPRHWILFFRHWRKDKSQNP